MADLAVPLKQLNPSLQVPADCKTPSPHQNREIVDHKPEPEPPFSFINHSCKCKPSATPNRLTVPTPFKYPERYTSPTDHIMSPISKGLLGISRKARPRFPPSLTHSKIHKLGPHSPQNIGQMKLKMET